MQCRNCHCELRITGSRYEAEPVTREDGSVGARAFHVMEYACIAKQCPECGKVQNTVRVQLTDD